MSALERSFSLRQSRGRPVAGADEFGRASVPPSPHDGEHHDDDDSHDDEREHDSIDQMLLRNRAWSKAVTAEDPTFFERLSVRQTPEFLFIGCSDSRMSVELLTGARPGDLFVSRNIANLVVSTDFSMLSVIQYAVEVLHVKHIVISGHYDCGGVRAALDAVPLGVIDNWLRNIQDVYRLHQAELDALSGDARLRRLVELNVIEQVLNVHKTGFVQNQRIRTGFPLVHAMVYDLKSGALKRLNVDIQQIFDATRVFTYTTPGLTRTLSQ